MFSHLSNNSPKRFDFLLKPAWIAFIASLVLSFIAVSRMDMPNRDGMLYIETASIFLEEGLAAAQANFDWVFLPVCIAFVSKITGLGIETTAYLFCSLFFAGTCAILVRITEIQFSEAGWYACLVVLTLPAFNGQRDELLRESGYWFFSLLSILVALYWQRQKDYKKGFAIQICLGLACLFRVEAAIFFIAFALWQVWNAQERKIQLRNLSTLLWLPASVGVILLILVLSGKFDFAERIVNYSYAINPTIALSNFNTAAQQFGDTILNHYSAGDAGYILFLGLLSLAIKKFILNNGIFIIPLLFFFLDKSQKKLISLWKPQNHFFYLYFIILIIFVTYKLFISSRYIVFLNLLTIPLIAQGIKEVIGRFPRWRFFVLLCIVITLLANMISLSPRSLQFKEAGKWLSEHPELMSQTYIEGTRTRYYAGRKFRRNEILDHQEIEKSIAAGEFEYFSLELKKEKPKKTEWVNSLPLDEIMRFSNEHGDAIVILKRNDSLKN